MNQTQIQEFLGGHPLFADLSDSHLEFLAANATERRHEKE